jgi:hypothetical protein
MATATQWCGKHVSAAMNQHATIEELLETVFFMQSVPRGYHWDKFRAYISSVVGYVPDKGCK